MIVLTKRGNTRVDKIIKKRYKKMDEIREKTETTPVEESTALVCDSKDVFAIVTGEELNRNKIRFATCTDISTLFNAINGVSLKLKDFIGHTINVTKIVITSAIVNKDRNDKSENPEKEERPCVHLFTDLGEHISTLSTGMCNGIKGIFEIGICPTEEHPLTMKILEVEVPNGRMHTFEL